MRNLTKLLVVLAAVFCLAAASPAFADSWNWTYTPGTGPDTGGSGTLTATPTGTPGVDLVTGISGTWDGSTIMGLLPGGNYPTYVNGEPGFVNGTCCSYPGNNNLLYFAGTSPYGSDLDLGGLGLYVPGDPYGDWVNIYDPGTEIVLTGLDSNYDPYYPGTPGITTDSGGTFALVPEPMTLGLLGCGLVGLFLARKRT